MGNRASSHSQRAHKDAEALLPATYKAALAARFQSLARGNAISFRDFSRYLNLGDDLAQFLFASIESFSPPGKKSPPSATSDAIYYDALLMFVSRYAIVAIPPRLRPPSSGSAADSVAIDYAIFSLFAKGQQAAPQRQQLSQTKYQSVHGNALSSATSGSASTSAAATAAAAKESEASSLTPEDVFQLLYGMASLACSNLRDINGLSSSLVSNGNHSAANQGSSAALGGGGAGSGGALASSSLVSPHAASGSVSGAALASSTNVLDDRSTVLSGAFSDATTSKWHHDIEISPTRIDHSVAGTSLKPLQSNVSFDNMSTHSSEAGGWRASSINSTTAVFNMKIDPEDAVSHYSARPDMMSLKSAPPIKRERNKPENRFIRQLVDTIFRAHRSPSVLSFQQLHDYIRKNMPFLFDMSLHTFLHNHFLTLSQEEAVAARGYEPGSAAAASAASGASAVELPNTTPTTLHPLLVLPSNSLLDLDQAFLLSTFMPVPRPFVQSHLVLHSLYRSLTHGTSITKLSHQVGKFPGNSILLLTLALATDTITVGAYISTPWAMSGAFGSAETRLFILSPGYFQLLLLPPAKSGAAESPDRVVQFSPTQGIQFGGPAFRQQSRVTAASSTAGPPVSASLTISASLQQATLQLSRVTSPFPAFSLETFSTTTATTLDSPMLSSSPPPMPTLVPGSRPPTSTTTAAAPAAAPELTFTSTEPAYSSPLAGAAAVPLSGQVTLPILDMEVLGVDKDGTAMARLLREQEFDRRESARRSEVNIRDRAVESVLLSMAGREMAGEHERAIKLDTDDASTRGVY
ncbi:Restriction of telomere capping protein 5 [Sorochytrium milnesiophthora]